MNYKEKFKIESMFKPNRESSIKRQTAKYSEISSTQAASKSPKHRDMFTSISPNAISKSKTPPFKDLESRYKKLEQKYIEILQKTHERNIFYEQQKKQLQKYQIIHQRDEKEIYRLRSMLGFITKVDKQVQVNIPYSTNSKQINKSINYTQLSPQEKDNECLSTKHSSWSKLRSSKVSQPSFLLQQQTPNTSMLRKLSNSPYSKYRFVATIQNK